MNASGQPLTPTVLYILLSLSCGKKHGGAIMRGARKGFITLSCGSERADAFG
jgi:hypothetical protein